MAFRRPSAMRAGWILIALVFAGSLWMPATGSAETCDTSIESCPQQDETTLLQVHRATRHRSLDTGKPGHVPVFKFSLDDPPRKRWVEIAKYYRDTLIAMQPNMDAAINGRFNKTTREEWFKHSSFHKYPDYLEEFKGIVETVNHPSITVENQVLNTLLYEMESPTLCSSTLWAQEDGTVIHGRNMDYSFFWKQNATLMNWPDVTFEAHVYKGGKHLYTMTSWPAGGGVSTGMRVNGWTFDQQTRDGNDWQSNLAAAKKGAVKFDIAARHIMETTPDFQTAVKKLYATKFMAPQYFIMVGAKPYEGAILSIDRNGHESSSPPIQFLSKENWHMVQTNSDPGTLGKSARRAVAVGMLRTLPRNFMTPDRMMQFMHTPLLYTKLTVYSNVMIPKTNYYKTAREFDLPESFQDKKMLEGGAQALANWTKAKGMTLEMAAGVSEY